MIGNVELVAEEHMSLYIISDFTYCFFKSNKAYAQNVLKDVLKELTDRQRVIIDNVLKDANVTIAQLAENLDVDERTIRRDITTLQKSGILHREGGRKDGQWVISIIP